MKILIFAVVIVVIILYKYYSMRCSARAPVHIKSPVRIFTKKYTLAHVQQASDCLFIYSDNEDAVGTQEQSIIRSANNSFGIPTRKRPYARSSSLYSDTEYAQNTRSISEAFTKLESIADKYKCIYIPARGLGTNSENIPQTAPKTFKYLLAQLHKFAIAHNSDTAEWRTWIEKQYEKI